MTSYEIFDLFCPDLTQKINSDNVVLTEKYVVGKQRIRMHILIRLKVLILLRSLTFQISCKTNMLINLTGTVFTLVFISCKTKILQLLSFLLRTEKRFECFSTFVTWRSILFTQKKLIFCLFVFSL